MDCDNEVIKEEISTVDVNRSDFKVIKMKPDWFIHAIQEVYPLGECTLVCEDNSEAKQG